MIFLHDSCQYPTNQETQRMKCQKCNSHFCKNISNRSKSCLFQFCPVSQSGSEGVDRWSVFVRSDLCSLVGNAALSSTRPRGITVLGLSTVLSTICMTATPPRGICCIPNTDSLTNKCHLHCLRLFLRFYRHLWTDLMVQHQSCLSLPVHAAAGSVCQRQTA